MSEKPEGTLGGRLGPMTGQQVERWLKKIETYVNAFELLERMGVLSKRQRLDDELPSMSTEGQLQVSRDTFP